MMTIVQGNVNYRNINLKQIEIMTQLAKLEDTLATLKREEAYLIEQIDNFELDEDDYEEQYDDMLNECYDEVFGILPSRILSECDPIAYRCGMNDYLDGLDFCDDPNFCELEEELSVVQSEIEDIEEEIEELEEDELIDND